MGTGIQSARFLTVGAKSFIHKMPGGAQAHLIRADDDAYYVVKFTNNPQHRGVLVNELIAAALLDHLNLTRPGVALVHVDPTFLVANPDVDLQLRARVIRPEIGQHFGSCFRGDPECPITREFPLDPLLAQITNVGEFAGILAFDRWTASQDARQCILIPSTCHNASSAVTLKVAWIDNGHSFGGPMWNLADSPRFGLYHRAAVYRCVTSWEDFEPWLEAIQTFPRCIIEGAMESVPGSWFQRDDRTMFAHLIERLLIRRSRIKTLIAHTIEDMPDYFPNWELQSTERIIHTSQELTAYPRVEPL